MKDVTDPDALDLSLKSFFLGPQAENAPLVKKLGMFIFAHWFEWRKRHYPDDGVAISAEDQRDPEFLAKTEAMKLHLLDLLARFQKEVPSFSPRYIGHMVSEISIPALLGHIVTLLHNPNNITGEVARVSMDIEQEAIADLFKMVGFPIGEARGHFTSGGTVANVEGLVRARSRLAKWMAAGIYNEKREPSGKSLFGYAHQGWSNFNSIADAASADDIRSHHFLHYSPIQVAKEIDQVFKINYRGPVVLAPQSKHYSWPKGIIMLGLGAEAFWPIELDKYGMLSMADLRAKVEKARREHRPILMVVSVAGTTELGDFDPIHKVRDYLNELKTKDGIYIWHHIDAAYGGFFMTLPRHRDSPVSKDMFKALEAISSADSITIDPHKLGYVPYASGAFLARDFKEYYIAPFDAPYLRFDYESNKLPQTLEGSRSAGGAVATWLTSKCLGFNEDGYGKILELSIRQRQILEKNLVAASNIIKIAPYSQTNILCFCLAKAQEKISKTNERTEKVYAAFTKEGDVPFFVSKTSLSWRSYKEYLDGFVLNWEGEIDCPSLTLIRLTLMNPFFSSRNTKVRYRDEFIKELLQVIDD